MEESEGSNLSEKRDVGPSTALDYLDPRYWDERFSREEHYEWFKDYSHFRYLIQQNVKPDSSVLELGCGNSQLSENLYEDGVNEITCIDLSAVAVERMQKRVQHKGYKEIKVLEADMLDLPFGDECFDVVIEKGTMDVLFVDSGDPWNPRPATVAKVMLMLQEFTWSVEWHTFGDGFHYFFYKLKKGQRSMVGERPGNKLQVPSINMLHEELESEDYIFRTNIDEMDC
ncbi:EEF1A lysine methyltransferase 4 isoform X2 [Rhodamnia argentea]|uniref:EEF1A lysine methyltransferase 4 isoform X2 n=1 Tax=Rhodamnia argentea TaxID=178133 RepID=A0A8B8NM58_9MYRT|nr:EEF1A lysine methyltransferase 4 isoform X2 [Rhodamnia argentea]